jgi:hypothetical protein
MKHEPEYHLALVPLVFKSGGHLDENHNFLICDWASAFPISVICTLIGLVVRLFLDPEPYRIFIFKYDIFTGIVFSLYSQVWALNSRLADQIMTILWLWSLRELSPGFLISLWVG